MSRTIIGLVGTCSVTQYSAAVTGTDTDWDKSLEGKYIRVANGQRVYTINEVISTTSLTLTERYQEPTQSAVQFQIGDNQRFLDVVLIEEPKAGPTNTDVDEARFPNFDN